MEEKTSSARCRRRDDAQRTTLSGALVSERAPVATRGGGRRGDVRRERGTRDGALVVGASGAMDGDVPRGREKVRTRANRRALGELV